MAVALIAACAMVEARGSFERVDLAWQVYSFHLRDALGLNPARAPIVIVAFDENSYATLGGAWSRLTSAQVIDRLHAAGARLIVIDRLYEQAGLPHTADLATAIKHAGNVVLAQEVTVGTTSESSSYTLQPLDPAVSDATRAVGLVNLPPPEAASDGTYRLYNGNVALGNHQQIPSLALAAARALGRHPMIGGPTFLVNFDGPAGGTFPIYSMADVVSGRQNLAEVAGKIVLVGDEVQADKDYFATPVDAPDHMYGVELHAHALNTLLDGRSLRDLPPVGQAALILPFALAASGWALRRRIFSSLAIIMLVVIVLLAAALVLFLQFDVWLNVTAPALATVLAPLSVLGVRMGTEERANRETRALFGRFVAPNVVARIVDDPDAFGLEGEERVITVLFSDIRGFTTLSEGMPPRRIVRLLSRYFAAMVEEIQAQGGTVDKYVGDAIMALFGAPDDMQDAPERAVRAALAMQERLAALNAEFRAAGDPEIAAGIGLHHGPAAVGVMGAPSKREYSAIGDTVNTASRLEGLTKNAGYGIVVSARVVEALPAGLVAAVQPHDLGDLPVKGRTASVRVFGLGAPLDGKSEQNWDDEGHEKLASFHKMPS